MDMDMDIHYLTYSSLSIAMFVLTGIMDLLHAMVESGRSRCPYLESHVVDMDEQGAEMPVRGSDALARPFFFVGESLALDLVNTEVVIRGKPRDLLDLSDGYAAWWENARLHHPKATWGIGLPSGPNDPVLLKAAKDLRSALRKIFEAVADSRHVDPADLAVLNRVLATGYEMVEPAETGGLQAIQKSRTAGPQAVLLPVAQSARDLLVERDPARLHRCGNDRCVLLFYDTTKSATRRWCSPGCMDRARSAQRYQAGKRRRAATSAGDDGQA